MASTKLASVPVTMLSGFLGAGKTTMLRELLSQGEYKIGCIVNDVAAINIDAKLVRNQQTKEAIRSTSDLAPTIELQNGCACCSVQDELFLSFEQILAVSDRSGKPFDRIVLENSGVAEPQNLRDSFTKAIETDHPIMKRIHLSSLITVVDSATFITEFACRNPVSTRPDLGGDGSSLRPVVDLLVEQIEVADYVALNKIDLLGAERVDELTAIVRSLNPLSEVVACSNGKVDLKQLFGPDAKALLAALNTEGQHRGYVAASMQPEAPHTHKHSHGDETVHVHGHTHDHKHDHAHKHGEDCKACETGPGEHTHAHAHGDSAHTHEHKHDDDCKACGTGDGEHTHGHAHGHTHEHAHGEESDCKACETGTGEHTHKHTHKHSHPKKTTAEERFGISSFVYSRRRPFHPKRLKDSVLQQMPVSRNQVTGSTEAPKDNTSPIKSVLRSKGFVWMSSGHATAYYWSHAGQHFELRDEGDWWCGLEEEDWPQDPAQRAVIMSDFDAASAYGDRRQEIVFIGTGMDQVAICAFMDTALLTDEEMTAYSERWAKLPDPVHAAAGSA